jgi:cytochrome d ubiquinol oxidase subunit II
VATSLAVPLLVGAALGNVIRGVPLGAAGWFELPLFGSFLLEGEPGALDWYSLLVGALVLVTLVAHGANWLVWKTDGAVQRRARIARRAWLAVLVLWLLASVATFVVAPQFFQVFPSRPLAWVGLGLTFGGLGAVAWGTRRAAELPAFLGGAAFIAGLLVTTAACAFPVLLPSRVDPRWSLTVANSSEAGAGAGLGWWVPALLIAVGYFAWVMHHFRGKASSEP